EFGDRAQGAFRQALSALGLRSSGQVTAPSGEAERERASAGDRTAPSLPLAGERHTDWRFGALPEILELEQRIDGRRQTLIGYPALIDRSDSVELAVFDDADEAAREHRRGLIRLFRIALREPLRFFERNITDFQKMSLQFASFGSADDLKNDLLAALIARACLADPLPADEAAFRDRLEASRPRLTLIGQELARVTAEVLTEHVALARKLAQARAWPAAADDVQAQLAGLLPKRFIVQTPWEQLRHLPRYLRGVAMRLDKLREDPARDAKLMSEISPLVTNFRRMLSQRKGAVDARLEEFRWMLEELRVSLFAQTLRTPMPVSVKRLQKAWDAIREQGA
ncbi:MAG: ATP-dependent helicase HrpA, partial [Pseudomonadota bacterium]